MTSQTGGPEVPTWTTGDRLRKAREFARLQQKELANALGISRNSVGNYEAGRTRPNKLVMQAWAVVCRVSYDWLSNDQPAGYDLLQDYAVAA